MKRGREGGGAFGRGAAHIALVARRSAKRGVSRNREALDALRRGSPFSAHVAFEQVRAKLPSGRRVDGAPAARG